MTEQPVVFKIVAVGESGVGKTCLIHNYVKGTFKVDYSVTVGVEFYTKNLHIDGNHIQLQIWDTAGQQAYKSIVRSFYRGAAAILITFSLQSEESFSHTKGWLKQVREHVNPESCLFLVGTQLDKTEERKVTAERAKQFMNNMGGVSYTETSAKSGENVQQLFSSVGSTLLKKFRSNHEFKELVIPELREQQRRGTALTGKSFSLRRPSIAPDKIKQKKCCS